MSAPDLSEVLDECDDDAEPLDDTDDLETVPTHPARRGLRADPRFRDWLRDADEKLATSERSFSDDDG